MQKKGNKPTPRYHHMIAGKIIFELKRENQKEGEPADIHAVELNAVVTTSDGKVTAAVLGKAQQSLQIHHMTRAGDQAQFIQVVDVIILNICNLGLMTNEEFNYLPPEMAAANQQTAPVETGNVVSLKAKNVDEKPDPFAK